jgi:hypothetical protein
MSKISMCELVEVLDIQQMYNNKTDSTVWMVNASIKCYTESGKFFKRMTERLENREFYITLRDDNVVEGVYDATDNLQNFMYWDPNKTMLYKQLVNVVMVQAIDDEFFEEDVN